MRSAVIRTAGAWLCLHAGALLAIAGAGCRGDHQAVSGIEVTETRALLDTDVTITVVAQNEAAARRHIEAGFDLMTRLQQVLNAYAEDSELSRLNAAAGGGAVKVSDDLFDAIRAGVQWHSRTRGAFDITVMPLVRLWRTCGRENRLPTAAELAQARALLGADRIELSEPERTVRLPVAGMTLDLGGLAKGYIVDAVARLYQCRGVTQALIAASGDILALGRRPDGTPWRVGIQDPRHPDSSKNLLRVLRLSDRAVSTSGNYQRHVTIGGERHSHIVDPRTGQTADAVPSVTVAGSSALATDILGTALSVLGVDEGLTLLATMPGAAALFVQLDERSEPKLTRSPGFAALEAP